MSAMDPKELDDLMLKFLEGQATVSEQQAVIEALESDEAFWRRARNQVALHAGLKALTDPGAADPFVTRVLERISHQKGRRAFVDKVQGRLRLSRQSQTSRERPSTRRQPAIQLTGTRTVIYTCAAAAALLITTGLVALWLTPGPLDRPLTPQEERRHQIIVEQLRELNLERKAVETGRTRRRPRPKPAAPTPEEATRVRVTAQQEVEEATRIIDARRRFVMQQLQMFHGRGPLPDDLDVDELDRNAVPGPDDEDVIAGTEPVEVGRVLEAEGAEAGVLIREGAAGANRLALKKGLALLSGDRIETARGTGVPCTSVRLEGGATLDLDRATSVAVLGRDDLRFHGGRIYAHIAVPYSEDGYREEGPPFSLQTEAGRFLTHELQAELYLSSNELLGKDLKARVDGGKVHLVNRMGHVVGRQGQELRARKDAQPSRSEGFFEPIWRGRERHLPGLPFGLSSPIVFSSYAPLQSSGTHYALGLALRNEIDLRGLQTAGGKTGDGSDQRRYFRELLEKTREFQLLAPRRIPRATLGVLRPLQVPLPKIAAQTRVERSDAVGQILSAARTATPSKPLLVLCHGAMTDVACAWLMDPTIAGRVVVVGERSGPKNVWTQWICDPWACEIVITHFRCVLVYHGGLQPDRKLLKQITDPKWVSMKNNQVGKYHSFGLLYNIVNPDVGRTVRRVRFAGTKKDEPVFEPDRAGNMWEIWSHAKPDKLQNEFNRIFIRAQD